MPVSSKYSRLCSWKTILIATALVWLFSWFPPVFEFANHLAFEMGMLLIIVFCSVFFYKVYIKREQDYEKIYAMVFFGGLLLRAFFALVSSYNNTNHDIGMFTGNDQAIGDGHFGYIEYILFQGHLPDFDPREVWGFYNPPGFYILSALVLRITSLVQPELDPYGYEALQCIPFFFSCMTIWTFNKILQEFEIAPKNRLLIMALLSYHPFFHITAATLVNDSMAMYFTCLSIFLAIRWYKQQTMKNILLLGLALGIAMFTKLNSAMMAVPIAFLFLYAFFTNRQKMGSYVGQFAAFLAVCAPLGLFHSIRNAVQFGVPLLYVQELEQTSAQLIENVSVWDRLFGLNLDELLRPFAGLNASVEVDIWVEMLRSSLFDEFYSADKGLIGIVALLLFWLSIIFATLSALVLIGVFIRSKRLKVWEKGFLGLSWSTMVISLVSFSLSKPFVCSSNYRYISTAIIFPLIAMGIFLSAAEQEVERPLLRKVLIGMTSAFTVMSSAIVFWLAVFAQLQEL